jgi:hypothetical protein
MMQIRKWLIFMKSYHENKTINHGVTRGNTEKEHGANFLIHRETLRNTMKLSG